MATIIDKFVSLLVYKSDTTGIVESEKALKGLEHQTEATKKVMEKLKQAFEVIGIGFAIKEIAEYTGEWETAANKLRSVGIAGSNLATVENTLLEMSIKTGTTVEANAELYQQLSASMGETVTQANRLKVVDTLTKIFAISGTTTGASSAAISDMSKALEGATVRWQEIKRAMQDVPALQNVISNHFKKLGTTYIEALQGNKFATADFIKILEQENVTVTKSFNKMQKTIPMAFNAIKQSMIAFFGTLLDSTGISQIFVSSLENVAQVLVGMRNFFINNETEIKKWGTVALTVLGVLSARFALMSYKTLVIFAARWAAILVPLIAVGLAVQDFITYLKGGDSVFGRVAKFLHLSKGAVEGIGTAIGILIGAIAAYKTAIFIATGVTEAFGVAAKVAAGFMALLDATMDANPIVLIILAIIALVAAFVYLQYKFDIIGKFFSGLKAAIDYVYDSVVKLTHALEGLIDKLNIFGKIKSAGSSILHGAEVAGGAVASGISSVYHFFAGGSSTPAAPSYHMIPMQAQNVTNNINVNVSHNSETASAHDIAHSAVQAMKRSLEQSYRNTALTYASGVKV